MMKKFTQGVEDGTLLEGFFPLPEGTDGNSYWGTKWDVAEGSFDLQDSGLVGSGFFETAWSPPIKAYEKLAELGFQIEATYLETGMCFAGSWTNESGDEYYDYNFDDENWRKGIYDEEVLALLEDEYVIWLQDEEK